MARRIGRLDGLRQDRIIEGVIGVIDKVGVCVALDHRESLRHAIIHARLAELDAAAVDVPPRGKQAEQRAVAAADIEHARAGRHHLGDEKQVDARGICHRPHGMRRHVDVHGSHPFGSAMPRFSAAAARKPRMVSNNSGWCNRKESWPLSVLISTKLTLAATAFSACTISRLSSVGNSQSEVKDTRQKRVLVPRKALASTPPWSAARSK